METTEMKKVILITLLIALHFVASTPPATASGSIAFNTRTREAGKASNYPKQSDADAAAIQDCGGTCAVVIQFSNECAALATDPTGSSAMATASGPTPEGARQNAINRCSTDSISCTVLTWKCDGDADKGR
jgi:hypothetical protein